ncbi:MAG: TlpA family protein disulfide reductase, partial [Microcella sp.]|nr:TlpA family protein disulfide reductase [Microcella sp.]
MNRRTSARRNALAALALASAVALLGGCTANDPLAQQYRSGTGQGYISGDGAYTVIAEAERAQPVEFAG